MLETLQYIQEQHPWLPLFFFFGFGACWGSFLNVVVYRLPAGKSVVSPPSHCYGCGKRIRWYDNLPILSWCLLRGRARCCGAPFSVRYAVIEALTGLLFAACWYCHGPQTPLVALAGMVFTFFLLAGSLIDLDTMELPDLFTVGGAVFALLAAFLVPSLHGFDGGLWLQDMMRSGVTAMAGLLVGSGVVLWIGMFAEALLKKEAMGFGDVLWVGFIGAFCGWEGALFSVFGGALLGSLGLLPLMLLQRRRPAQAAPAGQPADPRALAEALMREREGASTGDGDGVGLEKRVVGRAIPFGPWLALAGLLYFLALRPLVDGWFTEVASVIFS
jgi:leader peptidase (prepilin peptidase)/N-methyltransferase